MSFFKADPSLDDLAPATTKGDLLARNASMIARVQVGADNLFLQADSSQDSGVKWASAAGSGLDVRTLTGATTLTTSNDIVYVSGTTFPITLYTPVGNSGKQIVIEKTDGVSTAQSVVGTGLAGVTLATQNEGFRFVADGSVWRKADHWWAYGMTLVSTAGFSVFTTGTSNPVLGTSYFNSSLGWERLSATRARLYWSHGQNSANGAVAGNGDFLFPLPNFLHLNLTNQGIIGYSTVVGNAAAFQTRNTIPSSGNVSGSTDNGLVVMSIYNATFVRAFFMSASAQGAVCAASNFNPTATNLTWNFYCDVSILGWGP